MRKFWMLTSTFVLAAGMTHASTVFTVTLTPATQAAAPGDSLQFVGTLTNNTGNEVFVNNDSFTFDITGALDDSPFLTNAPFSLAAFASTPMFEFFDIAIPPAQAAGPYTGVFSILGGADGSAQDLLGQAAFEVDVATAVPEPRSTILLVVLAAIAWRVRTALSRREIHQLDSQ